jgi:hypothetical protein
MFITSCAEYLSARASVYYWQKQNRTDDYAMQRLAYWKEIVQQFRALKTTRKGIPLGPRPQPKSDKGHKNTLKPLPAARAPKVAKTPVPKAPKASIPKARKAPPPLKLNQRIQEMTEQKMTEQKIWVPQLVLDWS